MLVILIGIKLMLKGIIINTMSLALAAIILVATSGFTVFKHSCSSEKTTEFSILIPEFNCEHYLQEESLPPCCCTIPEPDKEESYGKDNCCETDSFVVKLNITIDVKDYNHNIVSAVSVIPAVEEIDVNLKRKEIKHIIVSNDLPPPLSGKSLHIFLQQLNIPYPSV